MIRGFLNFLNGQTTIDFQYGPAPRTSGSQLIGYGIQSLGLKMLLSSQTLCHIVMNRWQLVKHKASVYRSSCLMLHNNAQNPAERPSNWLSMNY